MTQPPLDDAALRRVAVTTLLIVRGGVTMADLALALGVKADALSRDLSHMTDVTADLYQDDCPEGCEMEVCPHAQLRLVSRALAAEQLMEAARGLGLVFRGEARPRVKRSVSWGDEPQGKGHRSHT